MSRIKVGDLVLARLGKTVVRRVRVIKRRGRIVTIRLDKGPGPLITGTLDIRHVKKIGR